MSLKIIRGFVLFLLFYSSVSCSTSNHKTKAVDESFLNQKPIPANYLSEDEYGSKIVDPDIQWISGISNNSRLVFAKVRSNVGKELFSLILKVDTESDKISYLPLKNNETPIDILTNKNKKNYYLNKVNEYSNKQEINNVHTESLSHLIGEKKLGSPLPTPTHIFAVAANYPSHLEYDLGIKNANKYRAQLAAARPRVFLKYPLTIPTEAKGAIKVCDKLNQVIGPFDTGFIHNEIVVPNEAGSDVKIVNTRIDYEAEIGAVIGKDLTWNDIEHASDTEILEAVAGYILVNDTKARNPQVMLNILRHEEKATEDNTYRIGNKLLDQSLGVWDEKTAMWWSYAASFGGIHSIGPFFVEAEQKDFVPDRIVIGARSFGDDRPTQVPIDYMANTLYLRQLALTTESKNARDGLIWSLSDIIRSILSPSSALQFYDKSLEIKKGDIISLGTPGGTVITVKSPKVFRIVEDIAVWLDPIDWHNLFFKGDKQLYMENNDSTFMWATGLGFQKVILKDSSTNELLCK